MEDHCKDCGMPLENEDDKCNCDGTVCVHCCKCGDGCGCGCDQK